MALRSTTLGYPLVFRADSLVVTSVLQLMGLSNGSIRAMLRPLLAPVYTSSPFSSILYRILTIEGEEG